MKTASRFSLPDGWKLLLNDMALSSDSVLKLAGLPQDLFLRENATLSVEEYFGLFQAVEELGGEEMPLAFARALSAESFSPPLFAGLCSPNLGVALERIARFKPLIGPMTLALEEGEEGTTATIRCLPFAGNVPRSLGLMELLFFTCLARLGTRQRIEPLALTLPERPKQVEPYEEFFGCEIRSGKEVSLTFAQADVQRPFLTENQGMWNFFEPELRRRLSELEQEDSTADKVKSLLLVMLPAGESSIDQLAERLALSKRTLQRHLKEEMKSYNDILNSTRRELAEYYLRQSKIPVGEIAFLLGYSEMSSFQRAFRGWTGVAPGEFRRGQGDDA